MTPTDRKKPSAKRRSLRRRHPSRMAFVVFVFMITMVSAITCWWLTMDGRLQVHLLPETQQFESFPMPLYSLDRG